VALHDVEARLPVPDRGNDLVLVVRVVLGDEAIELGEELVDGERDLVAVALDDVLERSRLAHESGDCRSFGARVSTGAEAPSVARGRRGCRGRWCTRAAASSWSS